jgi:hypothetical protein
LVHGYSFEFTIVTSISFRFSPSPKAGAKV